jgi:hypothetical protein
MERLILVLMSKHFQVVIRLRGVILLTGQKRHLFECDLLMFLRGRFLSMEHQVLSKYAADETVHVENRYTHLLFQEGV